MVLTRTILITPTATQKLIAVHYKFRCLISTVNKVARRAQINCVGVMLSKVSVFINPASNSATLIITCCRSQTYFTQELQFYTTHTVRTYSIGRIPNGISQEYGNRTNEVSVNAMP